VTRSVTAATLFNVLAAAAAAHGDRELMITGLRREVIGFRELHEQAGRFGRMLAGLGVRPGDRVALWMTNRVAWAVAAYGVARCGAVLVAVNTRLTAREVAHMLRLTRPSVWLMEASFLGKVQATDRIAPVLAELAAHGVAPPLVVVHDGDGQLHPGTLDWDAALAGAPEAPLAPAAELVGQSGEGGHPELAGVCAILSTSGTTAAPKGVMLTHAGLIREATEVGIRQALRPGERFYSVGPLYHCSGYMHGLLCNIIAGSRYYTTPAYQAEETWEVMRGERVTVYHGFVIPLQEVERLVQFDRTQLALDRAWFGAPAAEMARLERAWGARMCEIYGLTESGGNTSICTAEDPPDMRHDSDGRPLPDVEVKIIDPDTQRPQPEGTPGELCVRGYNVMRGYFGDADATARAIDSEGWLRTGDMGVALPGGFIKWLSRYKDVIRVGGENLSPLEVEEIIAGHPGIDQAAVVAAPHPRLAEVPVAFVMLKPGHTADEAELAAYCRSRLANFKVPRRFVVLDDFPRTAATMRIRKVRLREMAAEAGYGVG
jgi:acyl-CoA synthetase (AMP-forming)/AMP-acid ligase II